ncbi:MAG: glycosyltransferase family 9 protein [Verrucomicrobiae bacterium]|nr:glycosyltransferase family 9 protein [Verrucomicrobiae bacterium]
MRVLIVRLSALGDIIQGIPCLVALKESFPDWQISWLTEAPHATVLEGHPHLDRLFLLDRAWRRGAANALETWRALRRERFDVALDLQGLFKSGLWSLLSGAPRRIGHGKTRELAHWFLNETVSDRPTFDPNYPLIERYLEPARRLGADPSKARYLLPPASESVRAQADRLLGPSAPSRRRIALCPWSAWPSKNWPLENWRALAAALAPEASVLVLGGPENRAEAEAVFARLDGVDQRVGSTPLPVLAEALRRCHLAIGPDSGPMHLANATGRPRLLMIFGATSRRRSGPWGEGHRTLARELDCQPCFRRICPLGHQACLRELDVKTVLDAAREMLFNAGP